MSDYGKKLLMKCLSKVPYPNEKDGGSEKMSVC